MKPSLPISLEHVTSPTDEVRSLIADLEAELSAIYCTQQRHGLSVERIFQPNVIFFVAFRRGEALGCGGAAFADDLAEVKRMYVRPKARGQNIARAILARIEQEAHARGATRLVLETGDAQHAAIRLYETSGFTRRDAFGQYLLMPPDAIRRSIFFEKRLS